MGWSGRLFKALFGVLALVLVIRLMLVGVLETGGASTKTTVKPRPEGGFKNIDRTDPNYVSKRRVRSGPDPIHNRRAGNSGQPPGQV